MLEEYWLFASERVMPGLNAALLVSARLIVPSALYGALLGVITGAIRVYGPKPVRRVADAYVSLFRGTPLVVQLYFWYFALPYIRVGGFAIVLDAMQASILGFALCSAAYQSEYIRGGLLSIRSGQIKAARALGMNPMQTVLHVVLPQAVRRALPGCGNEVVYLIKYSSLASIITVNELTGTARSIAKATFRPIEAYATVAVYYLLLVTLAVWLLRWLEDRMSIPGFERPRD
ncbi:amino acid ABC transporter permease [Desulfocurvus sp.]|jgi:polar amino acid transport system permease protein|uniref:amino acid ABC transporter permease n=1 Tax=Desulfocurvus sp. TaxID=2871698 RepID=UPI0025C12AA5|nr:amino acid ABC transporter permease [Desulfocurvus sp.]MCK9239909.1 amino acid ABC transporter permease [Desulfocurvus sp.]